MGGTVIDIVIENGSPAAGIFQKTGHLRTYHGIDRIVRPEHNNIVAPHVGVCEIELVVRMILVKYILGIIVLVEKRERDGRFAVGIHIDVIGVHAVVFQEVDYRPPHPVVSGLADERGVDTRTAERYHTVEHRTSRHGAHRLSVLEYYVEHCLAYSYYLSHVFMFYPVAKIVIFG